MEDKEMHVCFYGKEASWKTSTWKTQKKIEDNSKRDFKYMRL
jgi:hypothetical protein